jgi:tetratricopeptide (TPR) repeat protein
MKRSRLLPALLTLAVALGATPAMADGASGAGASKKKNSDDSATTDSGDKSGFKDGVADGSAKYAAGDYPGAVAAFQKAVEAAPKNPLGHYFLGEAQLKAGNLTEAEAAWNRASLAATEKDAALRAKILFCLADLKERQKKWDDARAAWQVYLDWGAKYPEAKAYAGSGTSRQGMIDAAQKQDKAYDVVRQRIAATKNGGVFTDLSKQPPPPATPAPTPPAGGATK